MKHVDIFKLGDDGTRGKIAVCTFDDGVVECEGDPIFINNLRTEGIQDFASGSGKVYPGDGMKFLRNLPRALRSGYLSASEVI